MYKVFALALCVIAVATTLEAAPDKFSTKYDNVNLEEVLSNEKLLMNYYNCIMDKGKCTPDGTELKSKSFLKFRLLCLDERSMRSFIEDKTVHLFVYSKIRRISVDKATRFIFTANLPR